jgi:hypothetical protein
MFQNNYTNFHIVYEILYSVRVMFCIFRMIEIKFSQPYFQPNFSNNINQLIKKTSVAIWSKNILTSLPHYESSMR